MIDSRTTSKIAYDKAKQSKHRARRIFSSSSNRRIEYRMQYVRSNRYVRYEPFLPHGNTSNNITATDNDQWTFRVCGWGTTYGRYVLAVLSRDLRYGENYLFIDAFK